MKDFLKLSFFILILSFGSQGHAQKLSKGREFQANILLMRVDELITSRKTGLDQCLLKNPAYTKQEHQKFLSEVDYLSNAKFRSQTDKVGKALIILALTEKHPKCSKEVKEADDSLNKIQRKKFERPIEIAKDLCYVLLPGARAKCLDKIARLVSELDPFCVTQNTKDKFGTKDPNACMAGDRLLGKTLRKKNDPTQAHISEFLSSLEKEVDSVNESSTIDLWAVYLKNNQDTPLNRKDFLVIMAFLYYALGSAGGYVDGVADHYWFNSFKESTYPEDAFSEFYSMRQKVDWYGFILHKKAAKKKLQFSFKQVSMKGMNRHDYMAMFLSCQFMEYGDTASKIIPRFLGVGYESLDFVSHMKEKVGFTASGKNFKRDTSRYSVGSTLGNGFCSYKF
jgi:hypothetical protein